MAEYKDIEIEKLVAHPANFPGREQKMEAEMLRSIESNGIMVPLMVRKLGSGEYQVLAGHRRLHAVRSLELGLPSIPCLVQVMDDSEALDFVVLENLQRCELDPMDESYAVNLLMDQHGSVESVADFLSRSETWVTVRQGLLNLGEEAQEMVRDREVSLGAAIVILKVEPGDRALAEQLVLHPDFQVEPLNVKQAAETVNAVILEPARKLYEWNNDREKVAWDKRESLKKVFGGRMNLVNVWAVNFADIGLYQSSDFAEASEMLPLGVLTEHAPYDLEYLGLNDKKDSVMMPDTLRWLDLAQRHGLAVTVIPFNDDFRTVVNCKMLLEAEKSRMEHDLQPWVGDAVSKAVDEECRKPEVGSIDREGLDALDKVEPTDGEVDAVANELEWFIEQSRDAEMRDKVDLGAAVNYVLGVSDDAPMGFEKLTPDEMSPGARKLVLKLLCWAQGVDFWR